MARPTLVTITGTLLRPDGTPDTGRISFYSPILVRDSVTDDTMTPGMISDDLDVAGNVTLIVPASNDPAWSPNAWTYAVTLDLASGRRVFAAAVPYTSPTLKLSDLLPAQPSGGALYAAFGHSHAGDVTDAELLQAVSDLTTLINARLPKTAPEVVDSTFAVRKGDSSSGIRMRATGGAVDYDKMNGDIIVSSFAGPGYAGTQTNLQRWRNDGTTFVGKTVFDAGAYGEAQRIEAATGVAHLGAKNGLSNLQLCGRKLTAGAPTTGTWATGDTIIDSAGAWHFCTVGGTPGTWT